MARLPDHVKQMIGDYSSLLSDVPGITGGFEGARVFRVAVLTVDVVATAGAFAACLGVVVGVLRVLAAGLATFGFGSTAGVSVTGFGVTSGFGALVA
ncbi:hypothetical protein [Ruegeria arenilitoris]|uniref:hypothetical protein n=1 Tax=Ruegeria arenilitoris TaxID=1173585 RepID=UPI00147D8C09|nr:hypothetical protein [Ruegeria arenilitoris]